MSAPQALPKPVTALVLSVVCPGLGEIKCGHRRLGYALLAAFCVAAVWLMVNAYVTVSAISAEVRAHDSFLSAPPDDPSLAGRFVGELSTKLLAACMARSAEIHEKVGAPFYVTLVLYLISIVEAPLMAAAARRRAAGVT